MLSVVCRRLSSVTQVYCDKTAEARIAWFHLKLTECLKFSVVRLTTKFDGIPRPRGAQTGVGCFRFVSLYRKKQYEIELKSQLISN